MSAAARSLGRKPRRGRHLESRDAAQLLADIPGAVAMHQALLEEGFHLTKSVRPYLRQDGRMSLRFVWRRREGQVCASFSFTQVVRVG